MRKNIQKLLLSGLLSFGILASSTASFAQERYFYWGNPDIPYIEQRGFSLGTNIGLADLWSDVGTKSFIDHYNNDLYLDEIRGMGGLFLRYTHVPGLSFRLGVNYGSLYATDRWNEDKGIVASEVFDDYHQRYLRNLDVKSNIWEGNFLIEISPLRLFSNWEFSRMAKMKFQPYLLLGASGFHFNPQGTYNDFEKGVKEWVDLRPLRTEGQGYNYPGAPEPYDLWSYAAVGGIGFKFDIGKGLALGVEYQLRYTFTDYLDDASGNYIDPLYHDIAHLGGDPNKAKLSKEMMNKSFEIRPGVQHAPTEFRGDPDNNDMFSTFSVMFFWKINKRDSPWWKL